jgi:multidrug efflux system outer membrane protein
MSPRSARRSFNPASGAVWVAAALLAGCTVGPAYAPPKTVSPAAYTLNPNSGALLEAGDWWTLFGDPELSQHVAATLAANQDLALAIARYDESRALLGATRASARPAVTLDPTFAHVRTSDTEVNPLPNLEGWHDGLPVDASYEIDLWGRVRRSIAAARAQLESSADVVSTVRLSLAADTASTYLLLRSADREIAVLVQTVAVREEALRLAQRRVDAGVAGDADAIRARADVALTKADLDDVQRRRAIALHALAVLEGRNAPDFVVAVRDTSVAPPLIPTGVPAQLVERRPDIARNERALAASSEQIGVAEAAFFPSVRLSASVGVSGSDIGRLFDDASLVHGIGPSATLPLFDGGRNRSNLAAAQARYRQALATYRQGVLGAFRETQDALSDAAFLEQRAINLRAAVEASAQAAAISRSRYDRGSAGYFEVVESERAALLNRRAEIQNDQQRLAAAVSLIKALGGGWTPETPVPETPAESAPGRVPSTPSAWLSR